MTDTASTYKRDRIDHKQLRFIGKIGDTFRFCKRVAAAVVNQKIAAEKNGYAVQFAVRSESVHGKRKQIFRVLNGCFVDGAYLSAVDQHIAHDCVVHYDVDPFRRLACVAIPVGADQLDIPC